MKILANDGISQSGKNLLEKEGFEVFNVKVAENQLANFIQKEGIEILLVRSATKVTASLIDSCPNLKLIGRGGVGLDNIDVAHAQKKGIAVINTAELSPNAVAELVFAHLFSGVRFLHQANREMPLEGDIHFANLKNLYQNGNELRSKTLGIIGLGRIGSQVAKIGYSLGMKIIAYDPNVSQTEICVQFADEQEIRFSVQTTSKEEVLKNADFITLHLPHQKGYIIDFEDFNQMKNGVGIINASRGGLLNEMALLEALDNNKVSFAGLDVFENEPQPMVQLLMHPKISLTPHIGAATQELQEEIGRDLAQQILKIFNKK